MCVPQPPLENLQPAPVPSMQSADNLNLGGDAGNRGAAQLGRLMLRLGGPSSAASSSSTGNTAQAPGATTQDAQATPAATPSAQAAQPGAKFVPNLSSLQIAVGSTLAPQFNRP